MLELNGVILGDFFLDIVQSNPPLTGPGDMFFPPGPPDVPYTFTETMDGTVTSGFNVGGSNDLRLIVNNTNVHVLTAPTVTFQDSADSTYVTVAGNVTYNTTSVVPLPPGGWSSLGLLGVMAILAGFRGRNHSWSNDCP